MTCIFPLLQLLSTVSSIHTVRPSDHMIVLFDGQKVVLVVAPRRMSEPRHYALAAVPVSLSTAELADPSSEASIVGTQWWL